MHPCRPKKATEDSNAMQASLNQIAVQVNLQVAEAYEGTL